MADDGTVIGCVHHAWRRLCAELAPDLQPTYAEAEGLWKHYGLGRLLPVPVDGDKLLSHLRVLWCVKRSAGTYTPPEPPPEQLTLL